MTQNEKSTGFQGCPILGVGLGLRTPLLEKTLQAKQDGLLDWVEFTPENYMGAQSAEALDELKQAQVLYPLISHGVSMSIGSTDPFNEDYLSDLEELFDWVNPPWFSDHLCFSSVNGIYFHDLMPLPRTQEAIEHLAARVAFLKARFNRPILLENASYYMTYPQDELSDAAFFSQVVEAADCGMLLDVNNVFVNSINHHFDPKAYIAELPLERVVQIHVAGHHEYPEGLVDTHGNTIKDEVWDLLEWTLERCRPCGAMIERDLYIPEFEELLPEIQRLREIWDRTQVQTTVLPQKQAALV